MTRSLDQARAAVAPPSFGILAKSAAYTVATSDAGKLFACSGTWALTLPSAAAVGNGFAIEVSNTGTGKITITPNGTDTIGGAASRVVNRAENGTLVSDGTNWQVIGFSPLIIEAYTADVQGYARWSNGYTEQWGQYSGGASDLAITFPLQYSYVPNVKLASGNTTSSLIILSIWASAVRTTGFDARHRSWNGSTLGGSTDPFTWFAVGFI